MIMMLVLGSGGGVDDRDHDNCDNVVLVMTVPVLTGWCHDQIKNRNDKTIQKFSKNREAK